jgi:hypothetical protein
VVKERDQMAYNIVTADFTNSSDVGITGELWQWDYGQILHVTGLPEIYAHEVHFSNKPITGKAKAIPVSGEYIEIPVEYLKTGEPLYVYFYVHEGEDDGETRYVATASVRSRPEPDYEEPTPEEQSAITQTIAILNQAVLQAQQYAQDAISSADSAQTSETNAAASETNAKNSEDAAGGYASNALEYAQSAEQAMTTAVDASNSARQSADKAETSADRAEQAAAQSGYLWFYIENGKLYMDRTPNTHVDFYMEDGKLYVREVA